MFCINCGTKLTPDSRFCINCGAAQGGVRETVAALEVSGSPDAGALNPDAARTPDYAGFPPPPDEPSAFQDAEFPLRPLGLGQLFDVGLKIYFRYFKYIIGVIAAGATPVSLLGLATAAFFFAMVRTGTPESPAFLLIIIPLVLILAFALLFTIHLIRAAIIRLVSDIYLGNEISIRAAYSNALRKIFPLLLASIAYMFIFYVGYMMCLIPGIYLGVAFILYPYILIMENKGIIEALERSFNLVRGNWFRLFTIFLLATAISNMLLMPFFIPFYVAMFTKNERIMPYMGMLMPIGYILYFLFAYPIMTLFTIIFYYDLRVRKEGFDLELMAKEMGGADGRVEKKRGKEPSRDKKFRMKNRRRYRK